MITSKSIEEKQKKLKNEMQRLNEQEDELTIANEISEFMDIEGLRKYGRYTQEDIVDLHSRKAFNKLIKVLSEKSYLFGYTNGGWGNDIMNRTHYNKYLVLLDEKTVLSLCLAEDYEGRTDELHGLEFHIDAFVGNEALEISVEKGVCDDTSYVSIVDPSDNFAPYQFNIDGDCSSYNGMKLVDLIGTIDLANVVKKDKEDYHIQKIKNIKEVKQD